MTGEFSILDLALRGAACALMLQAALLFRRARLGQVSTLAVGFLLSATVVAVGDLTQFLYSPVFAFSSGAMALATPLFWLFTRAWFDDAYGFSRGDGAILALFGVGGVITAAMGPPMQQGLDLAIDLAGTLLALHACWLVWGGREQDLVEHRRQIRARFVVVVAILILWLLWSGMLAPWAISTAMAAIVNDALLAAAALLLTTSLFGLRHADLFPASPVRPYPEAPAPAETIPRAAANRLERLMKTERLYREPRLTIGELAKRLDVPEHRLRRYINGTLGCRNFSEYLNSHRLAEVCVALGDPAQAEVPILTIALDAGFGSLPAFNRAFRSARGATPSEYRRAALRPA